MRVAQLYKGATRPACVMGVPINAFVVVCGFFLLAAFWIYVPLLLLLIPAIYVMRKMTDKDDQIFSQLWSYFVIAVIGNKNRSFWPRGVVSLSPANHDKSEFIGWREDGPQRR